MHVDTVKRANSGLFVWCDPLPEDGKPFPRCIEVQMLINFVARDGWATSHGDIFSAYGARCKPDRPHPNGQERCLPSEERVTGGLHWNHYKVIAKDGVIKLHVNGKEVSGVSECTPRKGYIALQSEGSECHFKNIRIKELPSSVDGGFVPIFNGKDLSGWEAPSRPESFGVDPDGLLTVKGDTPAGGVHWLYTKKEYTDYVLRMDFKFVLPNPTGTAIAITPRAALEKGATGTRSARLRVPLRNHSDAPRTGAVMYTINDMVDPKPPVGELATGTWHTLELDVRGPQIKVTINGKPVNDVDLKKIDRTLFAKTERWAEAELDRTKGHIGLMSWRNPVKLRNIRVKELTESP
jgi:hypothetical protein